MPKHAIAALLATVTLVWGNVARAAPQSAACAAATAYSTGHRGVAVLILRDGKPICDSRVASAETAYELWSGTKSFVGVIAAAAVQDKLLTLDEPAAATLTEWSDNQQKSSITIRQLLSMTSGQPSVIGKPPSYRGALDVPLTAAPGAKFLYGATPMQTFGEVLHRKLIAHGQPGDVQAYAERRLLGPLGIRYAAWRKDADGNPLLPQGLVMTAREWAKFGEFVRAGGKLNGKLLVDPVAFAAMFRGSTVHPGYGLTWWLPHTAAAPDPVTSETDIGRRASELPADLVVAAGAGDQRLYVIPSRQIVIVRQALLDLAAIARGEYKRTGWSDTDFLKLALAIPAV